MSVNLVLCILALIVLGAHVLTYIPVWPAVFVVIVILMIGGRGAPAA